MEEDKKKDPPPSYNSMFGQGHATTGVPPAQNYGAPQGYGAVPTYPPQQPWQPPQGQGAVQYPPSAPYPSQPQPYAPQQPPPGAAYHIPPQQQQVIVQQPQPVTVTTVTTGHGPKPKNYMCLAVIVCLCFNCPLGIVALACAAHSDSSYASGDIESARSAGRNSMWFSIAGIVVSLIVTFALVMKAMAA